LRGEYNLWLPRNHRTSSLWLSSSLIS
jgi:hypothetical protein